MKEHFPTDLMRFLHSKPNKNTTRKLKIDQYENSIKKKKLHMVQYPYMNIDIKFFKKSLANQIYKHKK